jgi:signal transduction histidine kinase
MTVHGAIGAVHGRIDHDGRLIEADAQLVRMQERAGGKVGGPLAIPRLASLARLALRLQIVVSRNIVAASGDRDLALWVRITPIPTGAGIAITGWVEQDAAGASGPDSNRDFARTAADWICETDAGLKILHASGLGPDAVGQRLGDLLALSGSDRDTSIAAQAARSGSRFEDKRAMLRGVPVGLEGVPLRDGLGHFVGYHVLITRRTSPALPGTVAVAAADRDNAFGDRLSQALRNPLDRIIAQADSLCLRDDGPLRRDYADYAEGIAGAGRHLLALVDDLVDLQTIESADFRPLVEAIDLAEAARRAAGLLTVRASNRDLRLLAPDDGQSVMAAADYRRTLQILINLVGNAVRHSPEGGTVWVRCEQEGDLAVVIVADTGEGIAPPDHERIFDRFERLGLRDDGGTGLGLYIARRLARAMGGDVGVDSAPGQGARFVLTLPAQG